MNVVCVGASDIAGDSGCLVKGFKTITGDCEVISDHGERVLNLSAWSIVLGDASNLLGLGAVSVLVSSVGRVTGKSQVSGHLSSSTSKIAGIGSAGSGQASGIDIVEVSEKTTWGFGTIDIVSGGWGKSSVNACNFINGVGECLGSVSVTRESTSVGVAASSSNLGPTSSVVKVSWITTSGDFASDSSCWADSAIITANTISWVGNKGSIGTLGSTEISSRVAVVSSISKIARERVLITAAEFLARNGGNTVFVITSNGGDTWMEITGTFDSALSSGTVQSSAFGFSDSSWIKSSIASEDLALNTGTAPCAQVPCGSTTCDSISLFSGVFDSNHSGIAARDVTGSSIASGFKTQRGKSSPEIVIFDKTTSRFCAFGKLVGKESLVSEEVSTIDGSSWLREVSIIETIDSTSTSITDDISSSGIMSGEINNFSPGAIITRKILAHEINYFKWIKFECWWCSGFVTMDLSIPSSSDI